MNITMKPEMESISMRVQMNDTKINKASPSKEISVCGEVGFYSPDGTLIASKSVNRFQGLNVVFSEGTLNAARTFMANMISDVEKELKQQFTESKKG